MVNDVVATSVYVIGYATSYHFDPDCGSGRTYRDTSSGRLYSCKASAAHRSCLTPCPICAAPLAAALNHALGSIPSGERRRRARPHLNPIPIDAPPTPRRHHTPVTPSATLATGMPYGAPNAADARHDHCA